MKMYMLGPLHAASCTSMTLGSERRSLIVLLCLLALKSAPPALGAGVTVCQRPSEGRGLGQGH